MESLEAEFNRWTLSKHDFEEAHEYLGAFNTELDGTLQRALLTSAIVAYSRPFKRNNHNLKAARQIQLPADFFDSEGQTLHDKIIDLRDKCIAHSDYERKPTARVPRIDGAMMMWSKPFNPLSEGIPIDQFKTLAWRLCMHCLTEMSQRHAQLSGVASSDNRTPAPDGAAITLAIPLSEFKPR